MAGKTVRVRITVSVHPSGGWIAYGALDVRGDCEYVLKQISHEAENGEGLHFITADLPVPDPTEVAGEVSP